MLSNVRYEIATHEHADDIKKFLTTEFAITEPLAHSLKLTDDDVVDLFNKVCEDGCSHEKYSTVVYDDNRLVSICLCSISKSESTEPPPEIEVEQHDFAEDILKGPYKQHKANQIHAYLYALEHRQKRLLGTNSKVFKIDILCVHRYYRRRGLGTEMTKRAIETAKAEGCDWVATAATACASQSIFSQMGFQTLYEVPYSLFRENGNTVIRDLYDGCQGGKFMALRLSN